MSQLNVNVKGCDVQKRQASSNDRRKQWQIDASMRLTSVLDIYKRRE